jgi:hypothetical protein
MKEKWLVKTLALSVIALFIGVSFQPIIAENTTSVEKENKKLESKHLILLEKTLHFVKDSKIKQIIHKIIAEINRDSDATMDEIRCICNSVDLNFEKIYILANVKTTSLSDGALLCFPGYIITFILPSFHFYSPGFVVRYGPSGFPLKYGWHLTVDNEIVTKRIGTIIGYFGKVDFDSGIELIPMQLVSYFELDGVGLLVLHG